MSDKSIQTISYRGAVERWIAAEIADRSEVRIPDLEREAVLQFDADFLEQLGREALRETLYRRVQRSVGRTRRRVGGFSIELRKLDAHMAKAPVFWEQFLEYVGDRHVRVPDMRRPDLLAAYNIRKDRGERDGTYAALWLALASRLDDDQQRLGDVVSMEDVERLALGVRVEFVGVVQSWTDMVNEMRDLGDEPTASASADSPERDHPNHG